MSELPPLGEAELDVMLAGAFLEPNAERLERLAGAARGAPDWNALRVHLERHGVLGLFARNLARADASLPPQAKAELDVRVAALGEDAKRFEFTLRRFLRAAQELDLCVVLLKGASLAGDVYAEPGLRGQGDLDLLVEPHELPAALEAGRRAGLLTATEALPAWWHRRAHFHLKLSPSSALLREVEVHWALQHPSLLLTLDLAALRARCRRRQVAGLEVGDLDELDRLLHLATHLESHARELGGRDSRAWLRAALADVEHPLRLKWLVDLVAVLDQLGSQLEVAALVERSAQWGAQAVLARVLSCVVEGLGLTPEAERSVHAVLGALTSAETVETTEASTGTRSGRDVRAPAQRAPLPGLDLRASSLQRLPAWLWPPTDYLLARYGSGSAATRLIHASRVGGRLAGHALALPVALAGRLILRPRREREWAATRDPDYVLALAGDWRRLERDAP